MMDKSLGLIYDDSHVIQFKGVRLACHSTARKYGRRRIHLTGALPVGDGVRTAGWCYIPDSSLEYMRQH